MICKEDVVSWFKELESYRRIDTMCTLLNMCLPFELRFLGTCLEELGRRDSQELRGIELRVNNPQELAADIATCQCGEPTDMKVRRKMALFLALIRACSRPCVNELFKTLENWGERDFTKFSDGDPLQELLLVYTMATNHPVFSFEQRMKCGEIFTKIKEAKLVGQQQHHMQQQHHQLQQQQQQHPMQHHLQGGHQMSGPIQVIPQGSLPIGFPQGPITQIIPDANLHQMTVDGIPHMIPSNMAIPGEFTVGHPGALTTWTLRPNIQTYPPTSIETISFHQQGHPPQSPSPMLSQPSSPSHSRTTSPSRSQSNLIQQQQTQQIRNQQARGVTLRNSRRPSVETTPPPVQQQQQQTQQQHIIGFGGDIILPPIKSFEEVVLNADGTMHAIIRNGYTRQGHHTIPRQSKSTAHLHHHSQQHHSQPVQHAQSLIGGPPPPTSQQQHHQQQQSQQGSNFGVNANLTYTLQNMNLVDVHNPIENNIISSNRLKSGLGAGGGGGGGGGGSDSSSSIGSAGEISPPDTPSLVASNVSSSNLRLKDPNNFKQLNMTRLNGRPDKLLAGGGGGIGLGVGVGGGTTTVIYAPSATSPQQQQQFATVGNEITLTSGPNLMPSPAGVNSNNSMNSAGNIGSSSNNIVTSTVLLTSPSGMGGGAAVNNVITTNPVLLQQQQFSATYPYHAQHLAASNRPPMMSHNPTIGPPAPPGTFRHPAFQIQPNGDILYPYPPQVATAAGITFLPPSGAPPPPPQTVVRSSPSSTVPVQVQPQVQQSQQQTQVPVVVSSTQQQAQTPQQAPTALLAASPYTAITVGGKVMSCFNCGSQAHTGRDCQEASMEDVTRSSIYKLDYSASGISPSTQSGHGGSNNPGNAGGGTVNPGGSVTTVEMATETSSPTSSTSSSSTNNSK